MGLFTRQPTARTTPDPAQGGNAVTGDTDTGHGSTVTTQAGAGTSTKSCLWTGFAAVNGPIVSVKLKFDYTEDGSVIEGTGSASNSFRVQVSVNGGGAFNDVFNHSDVVAPDSDSVEFNISPPPQDITQIQVRDRMQATATADLSDSANITTSINNIELEITTRTGVMIIAI